MDDGITISKDMLKIVNIGVEFYEELASGTVLILLIYETYGTSPSDREHKKQLSGCPFTTHKDRGANLCQMSH